jgi:hypothetical protein
LQLIGRGGGEPTPELHVGMREQCKLVHDGVRRHGGG